MQYDLKTWPGYFDDIASGRKRFELRSHERPYAVGDTLLLRCFDVTKDQYDGRSVEVKVDYVMLGGQFGLATGYVVMGISLLTPEAVPGELGVCSLHELDTIIEGLGGEGHSFDHDGTSGFITTKMLLTRLRELASAQPVVEGELVSPVQKRLAALIRYLKKAGRGDDAELLGRTLFMLTLNPSVLAALVPSGAEPAKPKCECAEQGWSHYSKICDRCNPAPDSPVDVVDVGEAIAWLRRSRPSYASPPTDEAIADLIESLAKQLEGHEGALNEEGKRIWYCGCGIYNGVNLAVCRVCGRTEGEGMARLKAKGQSPR